MKHRRPPLALAFGLLLVLTVLSLWGTALSSRRLREREEARRQVTEALADREAPERTAELFRQARDFDEVYAACEEGARLESQGRFVEAAESFRACVDADPGLAAARLAWADALLSAQGRPAYEEVREDLRRFLETAHLHQDTHPEALQALQELLLDLEDLLAAQAPEGSPREWTEEEILEILTRDHRGPSPFAGPRVPLSLDFRPRDAYLGASARRQLDRVALALKDSTLIHAVIQIEGHTDSVEARTRPERVALAQRRAEAVRDYLLQKGVPANRLRIAALADDYPLSPNETGEGRETNRRVELVNLETKERLWRDVRTQK